MQKVTMQPAEAKRVSVQSVRFQRAKNALWEYGIMLQNYVLIIDMNMQPVHAENLYSYPYLVNNGHMIFHFPAHTDNDLRG